MNTKDLPVVELKLPGEKVTMCVEQARKLPFGRFPEAEFAGTISTGEMVAVVMPMSAAVKQLENLKLGGMSTDGQFELAVGKYLTIKRSENAQQPTRPFWDIYLARAGEFEETPAPATKPAAAKDPNDEFGEEMKRESIEKRAAAATRTADANATTPRPAEPAKPARVQPPANEDPSAEELAERVINKKRARMVHLRDIFRGLWKSEAIFQLQTAAEIAKEHPELPRLEVNGSSVNAEVASLFIEFNKGSLV